MRMTRLMTIGIFLNAFLLAGIFGHLLQRERKIVAAAQGGIPSGNGDVNGDGKYDITDAVYYLNWQFLSGPAPVPIECPPPATSMGLPATGQTKCYDDVGNEIDCDNPDFPGQDGFYQSGCQGEGRFVDHGDGTVTDNCTGLMWQKDSADFNGHGTYSDEGFSWQGALKYCNELHLAGHDDWRLPNVMELQSIRNYGSWGPGIPTIDPVFGAWPNVYWSSSSDDERKAWAWVLSFHNGGIMNYNSKNSAISEVSYSHSVRAVRSGP